MSFDQGLSGLNSSSQNLNVIGNNISNASTVGFKSSTTQFADVYAASVYGSSSLAVGIGSKVAAVSQSFTQGGVSVTNNPLDIEISGNGFFQMSQNGAITYTRNGQFQLDQNGYIVDSSGRNLTGYEAVGGQILGGTPVPLQVSYKDLAPTVTSAAAITANLDSTSVAPNNVALGASPPATAINPANSTTYNYSTPVTIYDPNGAPQALTLYFQKVSTGQWNVAGYIGGTQVLPVDPNVAGATTATISFDTNGKVSAFNDSTGTNAAAVATAAAQVVTDGATKAQADAVASTAIAAAEAQNAVNVATINGVNLATAQNTLAAANTAASNAVKAALSAGAVQADITALVTAAQTAQPAINTSTTLPTGTMPSFSLDLTQLSQYAGTSGVSSTTQDGYTKGSFSSLSIGHTGLVTGTYTNGQTMTLGQVLLTNFFNPNGLLDLGDNQWAPTTAAGAPNTGAPGSSVLGSLNSGEVEESNVDLTSQLVNLIVAQRMYQANSQTIKAEDTIMQTLINL